MEFNDLEAPYIPERFQMQWHITQRCNNRCSHCYQESFDNCDLKSESLFNILDQFKNLLYFWNSINKKPVKARITVTGGEPFMRDDFEALLEEFHKDRELYSFAILSNGSFISRQKALMLKKLNPEYVQLSIEGNSKTHDSIRGKGDFKRTVNAVKNLKKAGIKTLISFTAHRDNFRQFPFVCKTGIKNGVFRVWADRAIPSGKGSIALLSKEETKEFFGIMEREKQRIRLNPLRKTKISMIRAIQFLMAGGRPYRCSAGDSLITVLANGDLVPCRRMPVKTGNLFDKSLTDLYYDSALFKKLREKLPKGACEKCFYFKICRGGLRCLSYALTGDPFSKDPGCWLNPEI